MTAHNDGLAESGPAKVTEHRIMYICTECADGYPEGCGHFDRNDLRAMPDGKWLCKQCFDDTSQIERGNDDEDKYLIWSDLPAPEAYISSIPSQVREEAQKG